VHLTTHGFYAMLIEVGLCVPVCRLRPAAETQKDKESFQHE
jgi:hypothetical protein